MRQNQIAYQQQNLIYLYFIYSIDQYLFENNMDAEVPVKTVFTPQDLKLYVYGSRQSDQFWLSSSNSHARKPFCLTDVEKFTFNKDEEDQQPAEGEPKQPIPNPLFNQTVYKIACGSIHSIVLTTDGRVFTFGCNDQGALGRKGIQCIPIQVKLQDPIDLIAAGDNHSLFANSSNGAIYFTGNYNYKRGEMMTSSVFQPTRIYATEININNKNKRIEKLACGANHSCILINGRVYCRGEPDASTIGRRISKRHKVENSLTFNGVNLSDIVDIECGGYHTVVKIKKNKKILYYAWGTNDHGQLGIGSYDSQAYPTQIKSLRGKEIVKITAGSSFTLFLNQEGQLFGCGSNQDSNLGLGEDFQYHSQGDDDENQDEEISDKKSDKKIQSAQMQSEQQGQKKQEHQQIKTILKPQQINLPNNNVTSQANDANKPLQPSALNQPAFDEQALKKQKQEEAKRKLYIRSIVKIPLPQQVNSIGAGQNFGFAWNKQNLYSWGMGYGYVLLNGEQNDESEPFKVKNKIINNHSIFQLDAGNQHVLYTSYPDTIDRASVKIQPRPSVWENLSVAKHGLKRRR